MVFRGSVSDRDFMDIARFLHRFYQHYGALPFSDGADDLYRDELKRLRDLCMEIACFAEFEEE